MFRALHRALDNFRGTGEASVAVPLFDGPLKPNKALDNAEILLRRPDINDIAADGQGGLYAACSEELLRIDLNGNVDVLETFDAPIQALGSMDGILAVATDRRVILRGGVYEGREIESFDGSPLTCLNALTFDEHGKLYISQGSMVHSNADWKHDLMRHGATGRIIKHVLNTNKSSVVASGLKYCYGVCALRGRLWASESWAHRIVEVTSKDILPALSHLPGYPSRIAPAGNKGYWLTLFAKRTQLVEFVLRENDYREEMIRTIHPDYWIAPSLNAGSDFLEPLQFGAVKMMGILKPWAPSRSYGIVIRLNQELIPQYSYHSRADGNNHGTISAIESADNLFVLSRGGDCILRLPLSEIA